MSVYMRRGEETRLVPEWNVDNMKSSGWVVAGRFLSITPRDEVETEPQPGSAWDGRNVPQHDFIETYLQRAKNNFAADPVTQRGNNEFTSQLPRAGAYEWLRENVENHRDYTIADWSADKDEDGNMTYTATFRGRSPEGMHNVGIRRSLAYGDQFTVTFQGGKASEIDPIDTGSDPIDTFGLADPETGLSADRARQYRDRILTSFDIQNFPADLQDMIMNGTLNWRPEKVAEEVRNILTSERLGDQDRREFLAELVMDEYESSAYAVALRQPDPDTEPPTDDGYNPEDEINDYLAALTAALGGGGGGPAYRPPDRREVEENVQNYLRTVLATTGDPGLVDELADIYMRDHRRSFDNPSIGLQPWFSVKERVRQLEDYQRMHALRPETVPEEQWVTQFQQIVDEAGVPANLRDQTARNFAQTGTTLRNALPGAYRQQAMREGRPQPTFLNNLARQVSTLARRF